MAQEPPWVSGPREILDHGLSLLKEDTDSNRRLAMISIDNAVELTIKTYLGLPRRVTGIQMSRKAFQEISESFPGLLDALEEYAKDKLTGIDLGEIEWYHRLRNELYHQGNGLTVERQKVVVYGELAKVLFQNLLGYGPPDATPSDVVFAEFMKAYLELETDLRTRTPTLTADMVKDLKELRQLRNAVVHGQSDIAALSDDTVERLQTLLAAVRQLPENPEFQKRRD